MESKFRNYFRDLLSENGVWTCTVEHRSGGSVGLPDTLVLVGEYLLPVELKLGRLDLRTAKLHISRLRPAQIGWFEDHRKAGGAAGLLIGWRVGDHWDADLQCDLRRERLIHWREGFEEEGLCAVIRDNRLIVPPSKW